MAVSLFLHAMLGYSQTAVLPSALCAQYLLVMFSSLENREHGDEGVLFMKGVESIHPQLVDDGEKEGNIRGE